MDVEGVLTQAEVLLGTDEVGWGLRPTTMVAHANIRHHTLHNAGYRNNKVLIETPTRNVTTINVNNSKRRHPAKIVTTKTTSNTAREAHRATVTSNTSPTVEAAVVQVLTAVPTNTVRNITTTTATATRVHTKATGKFNAVARLDDAIAIRYGFFALVKSYKWRMVNKIVCTENNACCP